MITLVSFSSTPVAPPTWPSDDLTPCGFAIYTTMGLFSVLRLQHVLKSKRLSKAQILSPKWPKRGRVQTAVAGPYRTTSQLRRHAGVWFAMLYGCHEVASCNHARQDRTSATPVCLYCEPRSVLRWEQCRNHRRPQT